MQRVTAIFAALFLMATSFFVSLPHTAFLNWQTPERTVTDTAEVLALYSEAAKNNSDIQLRLKSTPDYSAQDFFERTQANILFYLLLPEHLLAGAVTYGLPGNPSAIRASDLRSAKAEYYRNGRILVITLEPKLEKFDNTSQTPAPILKRTMGEIISGMDLAVGLVGLNAYRGEVKQSRIEIVVNTQSGKIVAADFSSYVKLEIGFGLAETDVFLQMYEYGMTSEYKLP